MNSTCRPGHRVALPRCAYDCSLVVYLFLLAAWVVVAIPAAAQEQDKAYLRVHDLIQQADSLNTAGKTNQALAKYREAQTALQDVRHTYPGWNTKAIAFRTKYVADKIAGLTAKPPTPEPTNAAAADAATPAPEKKPTAAVGTLQIKLLEPGAEPRQALRLHPKAGDKQSLSIKMKISMEMNMGEQSQPMTLPEITLTSDLTVKSVSPQGEINYEMVMGETTVTETPGAMPQMTEAIKASFATVKGTTAQGRMTSRALNNKVDIKMPAGADAQTKQSIEQIKEMVANLSVPLPEEPIGAGAKWEVKLPIRSQGMAIDQTSAYQLASLEGEQLTIKATVDQRAANQKIQNPAFGPLAPTLTKMTGKGSGDLKLNLAQTMPQGSVALKTDSAMTINLGNQQQAASMKSEVNVKVESK